jgi:hypothetical protein
MSCCHDEERSFAVASIFVLPQVAQAFHRFEFHAHPLADAPQQSHLGFRPPSPPPKFLS